LPARAAAGCRRMHIRPPTSKAGRAILLGPWEIGFLCRAKAAEDLKPDGRPGPERRRGDGDQTHWRRIGPQRVTAAGLSLWMARATARIAGRARIDARVAAWPSLTPAARPPVQPAAVKICGITIPFFPRGLAARCRSFLRWDHHHGAACLSQPRPPPSRRAARMSGGEASPALPGRAQQPRAHPAIVNASRHVATRSRKEARPASSRARVVLVASMTPSGAARVGTSPKHWSGWLPLTRCLDVDGELKMRPGF